MNQAVEIQPLRLSVIICTYNRASLVETSILSVVTQDSPTTKYEIIVIDNNSKDKTKEVVLTLASQYPQIRYIFEVNQGLSFARNRGWQEAKGKYVLYLDDDAKASDGWLSSAFQVAEDYSPDLFGGPFFAFYLQSKPKWFKDQYGSHSLGENSRYLNQGEFLTGGNLAIRRSLLQKLNGFKTDFGMNGNTIAYGEETELQIRIRLENPNTQIYYEPNMSIWHLVRSEKMNLQYLFSQSIASGRDTYRVNAKPDKFSQIAIEVKAKIIFRSIFDLFILILHLVRNYIWNTIFRDKKRYPYRENYIYECCLLDADRLGYLLAQFKHVTGSNLHKAL